MSRPRDKGSQFLETMINDLTGAVLEDEASLAAAVEEIGPELEAMIDRTRELAQRTIGEHRRRLLRSRGAGAVRRAESRGTYDDLSGDALRQLALQRARERGQDIAVQHRELGDVSEADLRSLLEEWDSTEGEG